MGNSWLPWVLLLGGAAALYIFIIRPMQDPDLRGLVGGALAGDKKVMNQNMRDILVRAEAKDPRKAAEIRARDPAAYDRIKKGNAFYSTHGI